LLRNRFLARRPAACKVHEPFSDYEDWREHRNGAGAFFRGIRDVNVTRSVRLTPVVLLLRAAFAAGIIVAITAAAQAVGPAWAGLFSAFPTALLPLVLIVHMTYGKAHVHTIIKNFPHGIGSLVAYGVSVSYLYPAWGVGWGTLTAFGIATVYLLIYGAVAGRRLRPRNS